MAFERYMHIERADGDAVTGLMLGNVWIFPKLDGTNGSMWYDPGQGGVQTGSRNRHLHKDAKDNQGFRLHALSDNRYVGFFATEGGYHRLYGEWLVPHTLKTYREDCWRKFYVFDVTNAKGEFMPYDEYKPLLDKYGIDYIPPTVVVSDPTEKDILHYLNSNTYLIKDGEGLGEGIVMKRYDYVNKFGSTVWAKRVRTEFKDDMKKVWDVNKREGTSTVEREIVSALSLRDTVDKVFAKIQVDGKGWNSKRIPELLERSWHDFVTEELWDALKKHNNPTIDFKLLKRMVQQRTKEIKQEVFS